MNEFEDYLFNNTKLETTGTSRRHFGMIYEENGEKKTKPSNKIQ